MTVTGRHQSLNSKRRMAAVIFMKRRHGTSLVADKDHDQEDRQEGNAKSEQEKEEMRRWPAPVELSARSLLGNIPNEHEILKRGSLLKFAGKDWKNIHIMLTADGLYMSRPGEDLLRDWIPLHEIMEVKKRTDIPESAQSPSDATSLLDVSAFGATSLESYNNDTLNIVQIRTADSGFNR